MVDDEEIALCTMQAILERNGYHVLTAASGKLALAAVREHKDELALIILDLAMPEMGGAEVFERVRPIMPDIPILLTSGYDASEALKKLGSNAPAGFIQKPASVSDLLETVKSVLTK